MKNEIPFFKCSLKGDLLQRVAAQYPELNIEMVQIITGIQSVARSFSLEMDKDLAEFGLTQGKFYVLAYLFSERLLNHDLPGPSDIADNIGVTRGTVTGLLDGLEREEYIVRIHDKLDRRALKIQMTDKSLQFFTRFMEYKSKSMDRLIPLDKNELKLLSDILSKMENYINTVDLE